MAPARRLRLAEAVAAVERHARGADLRLLDAGCGDGLLARAIARRHPGWTVLGVDVREDLLSGARARTRGLTNVAFEVADVTRPLPVGGFDVALALECLEEIPDDERALSEIAAAVAPGGHVVVHVPDRHWRPVLPGSPRTWREEVRHGYGADDLVAALRAAGLETVELHQTDHAVVMAAQEVRDRIKDGSVATRALAFPAMLGAVRLERAGVTWGAARAHLAVARRPLDQGT
jgi:SAM-dependent methyltransferase